MNKVAATTSVSGLIDWILETWQDLRLSFMSPGTALQRWPTSWNHVFA